MKSKRLRHRILVGLSLAWFCLSGVAAVESESGPQDIVRTVTDKVIAVLRNDNLSVADKRKQVEDIVYQYVDFRTMSRLVLARNWASLTEEQRNQFMDEFRRHLSITYGSSVENYRNETVKITGAREEARGDVTVKTQIVRDGPHDIFVDYRLRKEDGNWKLIDVIIERVSLVSNFRSQFQDIFASGGFPQLIDLLRRKNEQGASGLKS